MRTTCSTKQTKLSKIKKYLLVLALVQTKHNNTIKVAHTNIKKTSAK